MRLRFPAMLLVALAGGCSGADTSDPDVDDDGGGDADADGGTDADSDVDGDTDADSDTDTGSATSSGSDTDPDCTEGLGAPCDDIGDCDEGLSCQGDGMQQSRCVPDSGEGRGSCGGIAGDLCGDGYFCLAIAACCDMGGTCVTADERDRICRCDSFGIYACGSKYGP